MRNSQKRVPSGCRRRRSRRPLPFCRTAALVLAALAFLILALPGDEAAAVTSAEPLAGISNATPAQMEGVLSWRNPGHIHPNIASLYSYWGGRFGIRADLAFAQMLHETGSLRYGGLVQPWQNNFAGIGATGPGNPGYSYPSAEAGVVAHYQLLRYYLYYRNVRVLRDLDGKWAVPGIGYGDAIARYATEIRYFSPLGNWRGNFNEMPAAGETSDSFLFTWYDNVRAWGMNGNWIMVANQGQQDASVEIWIGQTLMGTYTVPPGGMVSPQFPDNFGGPVKVVSTNAQPLLVSQRVLYHDTFSEIGGTPAAGLSDSWEFTWYDNVRAWNMNGNWILITNQGQQDASVEIWIGQTLMGTYTVPPGGMVSPQFPDNFGGPVRVTSTNGQPLLVSQRVIYKESFNELAGQQSGSLGSEYRFSWYDSNRSWGMNGDWIIVANRGSLPADVEIYVGPDRVGRYCAEEGSALEPGTMVSPQFASLTGGPVKVVSTNGQPLLVSQRTLFRDSFEELQGTPPPSPSASQWWFMWYDSLLANYMRGDWIMVANQGQQDAIIEIWVGQMLMGTYTVPPGGMVSPQFPNAIGGPVRVVSTNGQPLLVSQRVIYRYMFE